MRRFLVLLGLALAVGVVTYFLTFHRAMSAVAIVTPDGTDAELSWLKREFSLRPDQYERVVALHRAYQPVCASQCARYVDAHEKLTGLLNANTHWSPELDAAIAEQARVQSECHGSMLKYAYEVAACMSHEQGQRYLEMIKRQVIDGDPAGMFAAAH